MNVDARDLLAVALLAMIVTPAVVGIGRAVSGQFKEPSRSSRRPQTSPGTAGGWSIVCGRAGAKLGVLTWVSAWAAAQVVAAIIVTATGQSDPLPIPVLAVAMLGSWSVYGIAVWVISRRVGSSDVRSDFGLRFQRTDLVGLPLGVVIQLLIVPAVYVPLRTLWPTTFSNDRLDQNAIDLVDRAGGVSIVILAVLVVIGAPLVEETVYRGLLQGSITAGSNPTVGWLAAAVVFTVIHFRPVEYPGLVAFALVVGAAAALTGRLGLPIATHIGFNAAGLALAVW